jgi:superfamily II DNA or RNA helicase
VKCAILARPTKSLGLYLQQVGRIMRPWGDERAIVLDHSGCALEHGLPHADREFTLDGRARGANAEKREPLPIACPACFAVVVRTATACPICTTRLRPPRALPDETNGSLVELPSGVDRETWTQLREQTEARGYDASHLIARRRVPATDVTKTDSKVEVQW